MRLLNTMRIRYACKFRRMGPNPDYSNYDYSPHRKEGFIIGLVLVALVILVAYQPLNWIAHRICGC